MSTGLVLLYAMYLAGLGLLGVMLYAASKNPKGFFLGGLFVVVLFYGMSLYWPELWVMFIYH